MNWTTKQALETPDDIKLGDWIQGIGFIDSYWECKTVIHLIKSVKESFMTIGFDQGKNLTLSVTLPLKHVFNIVYMVNRLKDLESLHPEDESTLKEIMRQLEKVTEEAQRLYGPPNS